MKYPQLVSTRAVNAISDWLVSRLEQLGVEAPQIYSRLLLSLLQSSVQINDPIEFSNLETFFANRKGSNRRYPPCDTNTIKKINAVQCLREIVSSEQEIAAIEALVDELFEKLIDIEKQSTDVEDDDQLLVATLSVAADSLSPQTNQSHHFIKHHKGVAESGNLTGGGDVGDNRTKTANGNLPTLATKVGVTESRSKETADTETDPKKRYFRAFPALTKEMEDSFRVLRRNAKSLTWPVAKSEVTTSVISSTDSGLGLGLGVERNSIKESERKKTQGGRISTGQEVPSLHASMNNNGTVAGVKRKTKRRRNQALSKGKSIQNIRKTSCGAGSNNRYRSSSPFWDTDFEGCWEMGRDLIKEFIVKQNNRNRSTSESDAYNNLIKRKQKLEDQEMLQEQLPDKSAESAILPSPLIPRVDNLLCCNEFSPPPYDDDDDTLASVSEITDASLNSTRRLYKRDTSGGSHEFLPEEVHDDQLDFAQFKAKFDSSLEALWKNADTSSEAKVDSSAGIYSMSSSIMQLSSLPTVAPFKENLQNFWTNYYNHHFDLTKISQESEIPLSKADEGSYSLSCCGFMRDVTNTSDYCSMPSNLEEFEKSVLRVRRNVGCERDTPVNVFLQNSIWSEYADLGACDTDESFYKKVWNSTHKTSQLPAPNGKMDTIVDSSQDASFELPQYSKSKWSEGINVGPNVNIAVQSQQPQSLLQIQVSEASTSSSTISSCSTEQVKHLSDMSTMLTVEHHEGNNNNIDCTDSNTTSASTTSCSSYSHSATYNWQTPLLGQSLQPDMQSWSSSNPISLTEMYGNGTNSGSDGKRVLSKFFVPPPVVIEANTPGPIVTLENHSPTSSGFIEYSRIKSTVKILKHDNDVVNSGNFQQQLNLQGNNEHYADDENLLTSERTHFHPIKTYADGHSFDICSALDVVDYGRSESGYHLYLESEKYLQYTRNDTFLAEEESASANVSASSTFGAPLYATSNCDANSLRKIDRQSDFVIKFRLRNCEVACQTDNDSPKITQNEHTTPAIEQHPLCLIFSSSLQGMKLQTTGLACNDAIEALNKAVVAAAKAAASTHNPIDSHWMPTVTNYQAAPWQLGTKLVNNNSSVRDEVDFQRSDNEDCCINNSSCSTLEQWSMHEIGKKCELQGHDNNAEGHTLWGMCAACNNDFKSIPANRLLKDELQLEADEIMSDLKYMQDLYIGEGVAGDSDSDWEIGESDEMLTGDVSLSDNELSITGAVGELKHVSDNDVRIIKSNVLDDPYQQKKAAQDVFCKVNRLIADLLCRENVKTFASITDDGAVAINTPQAQFVGGLWGCNDESNIWQQPQTAFQSMDLLKHLNDEQQKATVCTEDDQFLSHLSWEHGYLAEIWAKRTPPIIESMNVAAGDVSQIFNTERAEIKNPETDNNDNAAIVRRNFRNLIGPSTSPAAYAVSCNDQFRPASYKRVQQFLNASVTAATSSKFKISNRKRRHSASQNFFHASPNSSYNQNNNNNNVKIADLNQFNLKVNSKNKSRFNDEVEMQKNIDCSVTQAQQQLQIANASSDAEADAYEDDLYASGAEEANIKQPKQTIITCKYWTTIGPMSSPSTTEDMVEGTTFSCLLDKSASILKHVTMVTRPLTR